MKFKYNMPPDEKSKRTDRKFLPSVALTVFSSEKSEDQEEPHITMFNRRCPQIIKIKLDLINRLRTGLVMPVGKTADGNFFLSMKTADFWKNRAFLPDPQDYEFIAGGRYDVNFQKIHIQIYSNIDEVIVSDKVYDVGEGRKISSINGMAFDILNTLDITLTEKDKLKIQTRPVFKEESLMSLMEAFDYDPVNGVYKDSGGLFIGKLKDTLDMEPESSDVSEILTLLARQYYSRQNYDEAKGLIDFILSRRPDDDEANRLGILLAIQREEFEKIDNFVDEISKVSANAGAVVFKVAVELMETHMVEQARRMFELSLKYGYREPDIYDSYGYFLISLGEIEEALRITMEGLDVAPGRLHALITAAQLLAETDKKGEASIAYETAEALYPESAVLNISMAVNLTTNSHFDGAQKKIDKALEISPEDPFVNMEAARILDYMNRGLDAQRYARTAIELAPDSRTAQDAQEFLSRIAGNLTQEEQWSNREKYLQARKCYEDGKPVETISILEVVTKREPLFWKGWFLLGMAYRRIEDFPKALRAFSQVDDLYPDQVALHHEIGRCLMGMERFREAYPHMLTAFRRHPHDPVIMANMALLYLFSGSPDEAERLLLQAQRMTGPGALNLEPYINEARRLKKRKESGRGNGSIVPLGDTHGEGAKESIPEDDDEPPVDSSGFPD